MEIVMIGSGNVAAVLGRKFRVAGHTIKQVFSRNASAASELAYEWDTESTNYKSLVQKTADVFIIAVNDDAIAELVSDLHLPGQVVAHTAASVPKEILSGVTDHYGVFYPLQSLRRDMLTLPDVPLIIEGSDPYTEQKLSALARSVSPEKTGEAGADTRLRLHVAAVMVSNFTNHLYKLAEDYCKAEGLDFQQLLPLINETAGRLQNSSAAAAQTGPAIRHDQDTIRKHLALLDPYPALKNMYLLLTESIQQNSRARLC